MPQRTITITETNAVTGETTQSEIVLEAPYKVLSPLEFWNRLTFTQQSTLIDLRDDPDPSLVRSLIRVWWETAKAAREFRHDDPSMVEGLDVLVYAGVMTAEDATAFLANWPLVMDI